jgi:cytoskeletal protein RodZ
MERFCDELRWERERRQVSIESICAVTKVAPRHVHALEAGEYGALPGGVFRKGILRSYLSVLELDEASWVERFETSLREHGKTASEEVDWSEFAENVRNQRASVRPSTGLRWMGVLTMMMVLSLLGWCLWKFVLQKRIETPQFQGLNLSSSNHGSPLPAGLHPSVMCTPYPLENQ